MNIVKIGEGIYCVYGDYSKDSITVIAQELCEFADWVSLHRQQLENEAKAERRRASEEKGWLVRSLRDTSQEDYEAFTDELAARIRTDYESKDERG